MKRVGCTKRRYWDGGICEGIWTCDKCGVTYDSKCVCQGIEFVEGYDDDDFELLLKFAEYCIGKHDKTKAWVINFMNENPANEYGVNAQY